MPPVTLSHRKNLPWHPVTLAALRWAGPADQPLAIIHKQGHPVPPDSAPHQHLIRTP